MVAIDPIRRRRRNGYWATRARVWPALFFRDSPGHAGEHILLGLVKRVIEPAIMVMATVAMSWLINRSSPYGPSILLWSCTGVAPIFLFVHISKYVCKGNSTRAPGVSDIDHVLVTFFIEFLFVSISIAGLFTALYLFETREAYPHSFWILTKSTVTVGLFAFGVGLVSRTLCRLFPLYDMLYPAINRMWLHMSGVYFVVDRLPPEIRYYLSFNPLIHAVTWFRLAFFPTFPSHTFSLNYFLTCTAVLLVVGFATEAALGDRVKEV